MGQVIIYNLGGREVIGAVSERQAINMLVRNVARVHTPIDGETFGPFERPRAVELVRYIFAKWVYSRTGRTPYSKAALKRRDANTCGYCGKFGDTVDHVVPRCQGGANTWLNVVIACLGCNGRKAGRTPQQAGMKLLRTPYVPAFAEVHFLAAI